MTTAENGSLLTPAQMRLPDCNRETMMSAFVIQGMVPVILLLSR